ncbi:uncharacterized protein LOC134245087 [Saccostrea cucullata]|uniref:uncharacterized protein LOC134245087 n=1 Tax=Saccostrea cuccullata TaxID=36930 RepID=UPI002ECFFB75
MHVTLYSSGKVILRLLVVLLMFDIAAGKSHRKNIYGICPESKRTIKEVSKCPKNKEEWKRRKDEMNCDSVQQSCTNAENFVYHCLPNHHWNKTIEVCAPRKRIVLRKCTEYNEEGMRIQSNFKHSCSNRENSCPMHYMSDNAYKYQQCYNTTNRVFTSTQHPLERIERNIMPTDRVKCCSSAERLKSLCIRTILIMTVMSKIYMYLFHSMVT